MDRLSAGLSLQPGDELDNGKYRIVRLLGRGGMGSVFEAEHTLTHKRIAIKWMHADLSQDARASERLIREAQAAARVRHPNVVDIYDVGRQGNALFLVMEYLEGESLSSLLSRDPLPMYRIIALLLPAMRAVAAAHKQGVIHRDIKPDNIFLANEIDVPQPIPKVLDFGISKLATRGPDQLSLTRSGSMMGTPRYMSYEQMIGDKAIDGRADVYAFGVILYEALTGRPPYDADTFPELIVKVATQLPVPPKELRSSIPTPLDRIILWAMARERAERLPSLDALVRELEPFATEHGFHAQMTLPEASISPSASRSSAARTPARLPTSRSSATPRAGLLASLPRRLCFAGAVLAVAVLGTWSALRIGRKAQPAPSAADARAPVVEPTPHSGERLVVEASGPAQTAAPAARAEDAGALAPTTAPHAPPSASKRPRSAGTHEPRRSEPSRGSTSAQPSVAAPAEPPADKPAATTMRRPFRVPTPPKSSDF